jgi:hypothetical protein
MAPKGKRFNYEAEGPKGFSAAYVIMTWCSVPGNWAAFLNIKKDPDHKKKGQTNFAIIKPLMNKLADGGFPDRTANDVAKKIKHWYNEFLEMKQKMEETGEGIDDEDLKKGKQKTVHGMSPGIITPPSDACMSVCVAKSTSVMQTSTPRRSHTSTLLSPYGRTKWRRLWPRRLQSMRVYCFPFPPRTRS